VTITPPKVSDHLVIVVEAKRFDVDEIVRSIGVKCGIRPA
jgi:hypothetical protein